MLEIRPSQERLTERLRPILELLDRQRVVTTMVQRQHQTRQALMEALVERQQLAQIASKLRQPHAADIAHLLEILPDDERFLVWSQVPAGAGGDVLWDVSRSVAKSLINSTDPERLLAVCRHMDGDDFGDVSEFLPEDRRTGFLDSSR